jgi:hypothetical protein
LLMISACFGLQGFARLSVVYGGTYMLNKPDCKVFFFTSLHII